MGQTETARLSAALMGNAGVLISFGGTKILLDSLYMDDSGMFSNVPSDIMDRLFVGEKEFEGVEYVLFSHFHPDHFHKQLALDYFSFRPPKRTILPEDSRYGQDLTACLKQKSIPYTELKANSKNHVFALSPQFYVTAIPTGHMGCQFADVPHFSYLFTAYDRNVLFLADARCSSSDLQCLEKETINSVFVTPLFFHNKAGQEIIKNILCPNQVLIYHLPFLEDDKNGYLKMAKWDCQNWKQNISIKLFCEPGQVILF